MAGACWHGTSCGFSLFPFQSTQPSSSQWALMCSHTANSCRRVIPRNCIHMHLCQRCMCQVVVHEKCHAPAIRCTAVSGMSHPAAGAKSVLMLRSGQPNSLLPSSVLKRMRPVI